jgi:hypothetical protein
VKDHQAVVELHSLAMAKNGLRFDNRYCWVVHFDGDTIDRMRAYLDSAMVARLSKKTRSSLSYLWGTSLGWIYRSQRCHA